MIMKRVAFWAISVSLLLNGCGIGGIWMDPSNRPLDPSYPYGARWVKEGMTRESRKADWVTCGGGADLQEGFRKWIQPEPWTSYWNEHEGHSRLLTACIREKGYTFKSHARPGLPDECDARTCMYP
jgi:hypothetical protein